MEILTCDFSKIIYWMAYFKGIATTCSIIIAYKVYKYFKNKKIRIIISERKEPTL